MNNLRKQTPGGGGSDPDDDGNPGAEYHEEEDTRRRVRAGGSDGKEFQFVNPRNITILTFIGKNSHSNPYLMFNNQIRKFISTMGQDGDELAIILDEIEKRGNTKVDKSKLNELAEEFPKIHEYDRAIEAALLNWTSGVANGLIKHGVEGGLDAWRKLYHKYMPLADDLHNI